MFRPGVIQPLHGIRSASHRILYTVINPFLPLLRWLLPQYVTTTEILGRAMIHVAQGGHPKRILETRDINQAAPQRRGTARCARRLFNIYSPVVFARSRA
jgi:hypothetical protein